MATKKAKQILPDNAVEVLNTILDELEGLSTREMLDLAEDAGLHFTTLYKWRREGVRRPHLNSFWRLAEALGYEITMRRAQRLRHAA